MPNLGLPRLDNRERPTITSEVTPRSHTGDPKYCLLSGNKNPVQINPQKTFFTVPLPHLNSVAHGPRVYRGNCRGPIYITVLFSGPVFLIFLYINTHKFSHKLCCVIAR